MPVDGPVQSAQGSIIAQAMYGGTATVSVYQGVAPSSLPQATLEEAQARLSLLPLDEAPEPTSLPPGSRVLFHPNPLFVGRADILKTLAGILKTKGTAAIGQVGVVTGLGGIGKTQLASEFVHRYGSYFAGGVFWLSFAEIDSIPNEVALCGERLGLGPGFSTLPIEDRVRMVLAAWQSPLPRLLVFDNCEEEGLLATWQPHTGGCRVLVTSRRSSWSPYLAVSALPLGLLPREESIRFLQKHRPDLRKEEAEAIARELGDLPLALSLAGCFLSQYRHVVTPSAYFEELRNTSLLAHPSLQGKGTSFSPTKHELHVGRTFALSFDKLDRNDPMDSLALSLLQRAACLAPGEPIPRDLLVATLRLPKGNLEATLRTEDALSRLTTLGLLQQESEGWLILHRLLHVFVTASGGGPKTQKDVEKSILAIATQITDRLDPRPLFLWQEHMRFVTDKAFDRADVKTGSLCGTLGRYLVLVGDYRGALKYSERCLVISERIFGPEHPEVANALSDLGQLLEATNRLVEAEPLMRRSLAIAENSLGPEHPNVASALRNLAGLLNATNRLAEAEPLLRRSLATTENSRDPEHPEVATALSDLGWLLKATNRLAEAEPLLRRAVAVAERGFGPEIITVATCLNNLSQLLQATNRLAEAEPLMRRALAIAENSLGPEHPVVASALGNLAQLLQATNQLAEAEPLMRRSLVIAENSLGPEHPNVATTLIRLAHLLRTNNRLVEAEPLMRRALSIAENSLGPKHTTVATCLNNLARLLQATNRLVEAEPLMRRSLAIVENSLGPEHPNIASALRNLAGLLQATNRQAEAEPLMRRASAIAENSLDTEYRQVAIISKNLDALVNDTNRLVDGEPLTP